MVLQMLGLDAIEKLVPDVDAREHYFSAFQRWWEEDFSWEGLARKEHSRADGTPSSLQSQFNEQEAPLIRFDNRLWTVLHLPTHYPDGSPVENDVRNAKGESLMSGLVHRRLMEAQKSSRAAPLQGVIFDSFSPHQLRRDAQNPIPLVANFDFALFHQDASFVVSPVAKAQFDNTCFLKAAQFANGFGNQASFRQATFLSHARFELRQFSSEADFSNAKFIGRAHFDGASFARCAKFSNAKFFSPASFAGATFANGLLFDHVKCLAGFNMRAARPGEHGTDVLNAPITFDFAEFHGEADFSRRQFSGPTSFLHARFCDLAVFTGARLDHNTKFGSSVFLPPDVSRQTSDSHADKLWREKRVTDFEAAYRVLREHAINDNSHDDEQRFYALELDMRVQRRDIPRAEKAAAWLFKTFSSYGRSLSRPWLWWGASILLSWILFASYLVLVREDEALSNRYSLFCFVLSRFIPIPGAWSFSATDGRLLPWVANLYEHQRVAVALLTVFAWTSTVGTLGLFFVTLRRRFAIK